MSHWVHSAGTAVEWQLDVVIDIYLWISLNQVWLLRGCYSIFSC